ncbi:hypothetical protein QVZ41_11255 [Wenyingzhuangia sp. chi5]|uniref:Uncharacterized protein n=1 Tax=Wenyingzhuangia gilva TaxID=3057677 RepID=A0ABT8VTY1_9FLAO|nr:hypothetical protein [Wenyingzhuangia sp. chi5]MDO3695416.1 hypothetical protein [Wenyingzhuangia sp. chi5]
MSGFFIYIVCFFNLVTPNPTAANINTTTPIFIGRAGGCNPGGGGGGPGAALAEKTIPAANKTNIL